MHHLGKHEIYGHLHGQYEYILRQLVSRNSPHVIEDLKLQNYTPRNEMEI